MKKTSDNKTVWFVYFIKHYTWIYKIGITKNLNQRLRQYNLGSPIDINIIFIAKLYEYWKCEREVINYFKTLEWTLKNEWSKIDDNQAINVIKMALKYKWAIVFNENEVVNWYIKWDCVWYKDFYHEININKAVNLCNNFFKSFDFS